MSRKAVWATVMFLFTTSVVTAGDLDFPLTEAEIIKALGQSDDAALTAADGTTYTAENGRIYKIVGGKRYRLRGIQVARATAGLPKAGALINFDVDTAAIKPDSLPLLDEYGKALKEGLPDAVVMVAGHTDSNGPEAYNQQLSKKRAQAVADYLKASHSIDPKRLVVKGFGERQPLADNDTAENRSRNRRVEFIRIQ